MKKNDVRAEDVASKLGIAFQTVHRILSGTTNPRRSTVKQIAALIGVSEAELLNGPMKTGQDSRKTAS